MKDLFFDECQWSKEKTYFLPKDRKRLRLCEILQFSSKFTNQKIWNEIEVLVVTVQLMTTLCIKPTKLLIIHKSTIKINHFARKFNKLGDLYWKNHLHISTFQTEHCSVNSLRASNVSEKYRTKIFIFNNRFFVIFFSTILCQHYVFKLVKQKINDL